MASENATTDADVLNLLSDAGPLTMSDIIQHFAVTRTAVRERLLRLMAEGLADRKLVRRGRGRPSHRYSLSPKARKLAGNNFADFAVVLWQQMLGKKDSQRRQHVIRNIASGLNDLYADAIRGTTLKARMESLRELLEKRTGPLWDRYTERWSYVHAPRLSLPRFGRRRQHRLSDGNDVVFAVAR